jgi:hypothetical protein
MRWLRRWALGSDDAVVFVRLAVAQGQPERAARLLGAAAAWFDARGTSIGQTERAKHDRSIAAARVQLGDEVFAPAWAPAKRCRWSRFLPRSSLLIRAMRARRCSSIGD